jgi:hypothetical protein
MMKRKEELWIFIWRFELKTKYISINYSKKTENPLVSL